MIDHSPTYPWSTLLLYGVEYYKALTKYKKYRTN